MSFFSGVKKLIQDIRKWTWHHASVFVLTFFLYACFHSCRKAFSNVKNRMGKSITPANASLYPSDIWRNELMFNNLADANVFLGELDFLFLLAYAIGLYLSGFIGDRVNLRHMLAIGMCGSGLATFLFGYISAVFSIQNKMYYRCFYFLNGLFQSTGWPASVAVMGNWFSKSSSGLVFGIWSSNASVGNIIGSLIVASVIDYGYEFGILLNSLLCFCGGIIIFFCLIPHPNDIGLHNPDSQNHHVDSEESENRESIHDQNVNDNAINGVSLELKDNAESNAPSNSTKGKKPKAISFLGACMIPGVAYYGLAYACLKMVNYSFFFWLPTYLSQGLHWNDKISDDLSNFYDIGGILGGIAAGVISDIIGFRSPVVSSMLLLSMGSVYMYNRFGTTYSINTLLMFLTGFLLGGPANTISTTIAADLGKDKRVRGNAEALATVTGIIDGTGSVGAAIGQYLVGVINKFGGWHWVFYFLIIMLGVSFTLILPILINELKLWKNSGPICDEPSDGHELDVVIQNNNATVTTNEV